MKKAKLWFLKVITSLLVGIMDNKNRTSRVIAYQQDGVTPFREYVFDSSGQLKKHILYHDNGKINIVEKYEGGRVVLKLSYYETGEIFGIEIREPGMKEVCLEFNRQGEVAYTCLRGKSMKEVLDKVSEGNRW